MIADFGVKFPGGNFNRLTYGGYGAWSGSAVTTGADLESQKFEEPWLIDKQWFMVLAGQADRLVR